MGRIPVVPLCSDRLCCFCFGQNLEGQFRPGAIAPCPSDSNGSAPYQDRTKTNSLYLIQTTIRNTNMTTISYEKSFWFVKYRQLNLRRYFLFSTISKKSTKSLAKNFRSRLKSDFADSFENGTKLKIPSEIYSQIKVEIFRIFSIEYKFACRIFCPFNRL